LFINILKLIIFLKNLFYFPLLKISNGGEDLISPPTPIKLNYENELE